MIGSVLTLQYGMSVEQRSRNDDAAFAVDNWLAQVRTRSDPDNLILPKSCSAGLTFACCVICGDVIYGDLRRAQLGPRILNCVAVSAED